MTNPIPVRLKSARKAAGYTQQQLGMALGMEPNTASARMNQYEKGKHTPDYQTMKRIADELGVPVAYFYCDDDLLAELICALGKVDAQKKQELLDEIKALKEKS
ncbi:helix-turn-helix domain-containing protein [Photobacterium sp. ZSDE20]|uniref:Helix-turn-helix domain-containing protein n=1 Tax=Photobacterium pectinilyticum TaxID=2906793 RepID=A0ABT1N4C3_9GAMM|nr:helix-turn-helix transcriptional regulator [Photobacterium sp. ZSDE20]MCQ1059569.1 helix-turn-helix domain-containing protein [Photobacterium sp. ZSDE20]MDD1825432.1 helix-turn-helix domain-containing protein [Photobacterium sp. ZSDE20]